MRKPSLVCFLFCVTAACSSSETGSSNGGTGQGGGSGGGYYDPTTTGDYAQGTGGEFSTSASGKGGAGGSGGAVGEGGANAGGSMNGPGVTSGTGGGDGAGGGTVSDECCEAVATPGCGDPQLEQCVCDIDSYCCDVEWDEECLQIAAGPCDACPDVIITTNCCEASPAAGCRDPDVEACVCRVDSYCCEDQWDENCVDIANVDCNAC